MASISSSKNGGVITFNSSDWLGGLSPDGQISSSNTQKAVQAIGASRIQAINPFITYGILQPGKAPSNATNVSSLAGTVVAGKIANSTNAYLVDTGGKFHEYNYNTRTISTTSPFPKTITGTSPVGQDVVIYKHNSSSAPVFSAFYSYYNNANWDVGAFVNLSGTPDDDFMSSVPTTPLDITSGDGDDSTQRTKPHPMCVGSDDILYIGSGRYIHAYDGASGTNGTFQSKVLSLPQGFTINALLKYQDILLIGGNYTSADSDLDGEALVYVWNYIDQDITEAIPLEDNKLSALFVWRGRPAVITQGETEGRGKNKVKIINGNSAILVASFNQAAPINNGVDSSSNALLINVGGRIVQIGDQFTGGFAVHNIGIDSTNGNSGWIKNIQALGITSSSGNGSTYTLSNFNQTNWEVASSYTTPYYQPPIPPGYRARVKNVYIDFFRTFSTADLTVTLGYDFATTTQNIETNQTTLSGNLIKKYTLSSTAQPFSQFSSINVQFVWGASATASANPPAISRVMVEYEYIAI